MFTSLVMSWVRNGRQIFVPVAKLSVLSAGTISSRTLNLTEVPVFNPRHGFPRLLTPAPTQLSGSASLTTSPHGDADQQDSSSIPADGENFGTISTNLSSRRSFRKASPDIQDLRHQEDDASEEKCPVNARKTFRRRNTPYWYFLQCKKLIKQNKLQEALDLFSRDMLEGERLQPEEYNYTVLIGGCGRAGQLKKAFRLYNDMKKRGLIPVDATYTALFNACAESPSKEAGLQQALKLEQELQRDNCPLSTITYHALLKTHAITNHLQACLHTLREMLQNGHAVTQETFHYLLMSCLNDKDSGFRMALQVWRQMLRSGIRPDTKNYNLLLRTTRDCGLGDNVLATAILLGPDSEKKGGLNVKSRSKDIIDIDLLERQLFIQPDLHTDNGKNVSSQESMHLSPVRQKENYPVVELADNSTAPNLLDLFEGKKNAMVSISTINGPADRLMLIGGATGFLEKMEANGLSPDLRTLTLLADTMEPGYECLQMLFKVAKKHQVKLDVTFFNSAIRRAAKAGDLDGAKAVVSVMRQRNVNVDVQTFGSLALGCERQKEGLQLLRDMEGAGLRPNVQVFSALIGRAAQRLDYLYLTTILKTMSDMKVWPNEVIIKQLEFAAQYPPNYNQYKSRNNYLVHINGFRGYYQQWLRNMPALSSEEEQAELQLQIEAQKNQRAAASRYRSRNKDKTTSTVSAL